jgi:hypothetical protein
MSSPLLDAFFELFAILNGKYVRLYRSEIVHDNNEPIWVPVDVSVDELGGLDAPFAIKCLNWDKTGDHLCIISFWYFSPLLYI